MPAAVNFVFDAAAFLGLGEASSPAIACSTDSFQSSPQAAEAEVAAGSTARRAEGRSDSSESSTTPKGVSGRKQVTAARA